MSEFDALSPTPDPYAVAAQATAPSRSRRDWIAALPALGALLGGVHGHRARKKMMELTGEYVSRRKILDEGLYGATLGWMPMVLRDAKRGLTGESGMNKSAGVGTGAGLGYMIAGPAGAGIGARIGRDDYDKRYHGSPGWRAFGGGIAGGMAGFGAGTLAAAMSEASHRGSRRAAHVGLVLGGLAGSILGAKSVETSMRSKHSAYTAAFAMSNVAAVHERSQWQD